MNYELFSYPRCTECAGVRQYLKERGIQFEEHDLSSLEGIKRIRDHLKTIREGVERDKSGGIKLPLVLMLDDDKIVDIVQDRESLEKCLLRD